jgi:hypothetical protein
VSATSKTTAAVWRRAQHGWPARFPVVQFPNAPLFVALAAAVASRLTHGTAHDYSRAVFYAGITAWAWDELSQGVNWFRRVVGAAGLVYVIVKLGAAFGS